MLFGMIAIAGQPPPYAARPMGKQGFEPPDHFSAYDPLANFF
jgi:hypothetical protein